MAARTAADGMGADGVGATEWLEMGGEKKPLGEEAAGDERAWLRGRLRTAAEMGAENGVRGRLRTADGKWVRRTARMAADGVGATEWLEMGGEKKPLVMSELGCADGCGLANGWGEAAGCMSELGCAKKAWAADGKWVRRSARTVADGAGCNGVAGNGWGEEAAGDERPWLRGRLRTEKWVRRIAWTAADGLGATEWLEMGGEKKPLVMSELGCADGCGRQMGAENCADGCGRRGCQAVAGNGWGEEAAGDERAWLRGRLRTGNGCGELRGRLRTAWVQGGGWKWKPLVMNELGCADGCGRQMGAENCGATEWLEMGGEKKPLVMSELGCADGCGRQMGAENCADGCGRRGSKGVAGNGWGEEAAGDERAWLRGRLRTANGWGEWRGWRTAWVQGSGWKWVGRRSRW